MITQLRRLFIGQPIATHRESLERLGLLGGLAVFAADALSSTAYGTEEIIRALILAGSEALVWVVPIGVAVVALLAVVAISYRQTVIEYPSGGGAYVVARDNLGTTPSLVAGAALQTDYVLTVAVSVAAGVAAITSAWPALHDHRVAIGIASIVFIALVNLRGVRESAVVFGVPVYSFIALMITLIVLGLGRLLFGTLEPVSAEPVAATHPLTLLLILRAFSSGGATLTGVEAVANGVQAFAQPSGRSAARVLGILAVLLGAMFVGTTVLAHAMEVHPLAHETVLSQVAAAVFGRGGLYYALQVATAIILIIAANTSFAGFPRLSAFMAQDGFVHASSPISATAWSTPTASSSSPCSRPCCWRFSAATCTRSSRSTPSAFSLPSRSRSGAWCYTGGPSATRAGGDAPSLTASAARSPASS